MSTYNLEQLKQESNSWRQRLRLIAEENVHLKYQLAEVVKDKLKNDMLEDIEKFQSMFIKEDEVIKLLRKDIASLNELISKASANQDNWIDVSAETNVVRNHLSIAEKQFIQLRQDFNNYLSKKIA